MGTGDSKQDTLLSVTSEKIHREEQKYPNHIYKMPVPGRSDKAEVPVRIEVPKPEANPYQHQEYQSHCHMQAMKAGHRVKRRPERAAGLSELVVDPQEAPVIALKAKEDHTEDDRSEHEPICSTAFVSQ